MNGLNSRSPIRGFQQFVKKPILGPQDGGSLHFDDKMTGNDDGGGGGDPTMHQTAAAPEAAAAKAAEEQAAKAAEETEAGKKREREEPNEGEVPNRVSPEHQRPARTKDTSMDTEKTSEESPTPGDVPNTGGQAGGAASTPKTGGGRRNAFQVLRNAMHAKSTEGKATKKTAPVSGEGEDNEGDKDVDMADEAETYTTVTSRKSPALDILLFENKLLLFLTFRVGKGGNMSTGDKIRNRTAQVLDMIIEGFSDCLGERGGIIFLPLKSTDHSQVLQRGSQLPKKYSGIKKFISFLNPQEDFTKNIGGDNGRQFRAVVRVGTKKPFAESMGDMLLDWAIEGVEVEVKRLQVVHSSADLILPHVPRDIELEYVREVFPECLEEAKKAYYNDPRLDMNNLQRGVGIAQKPFDIFISWNFAPNSYDNSRKRGGGRSKMPTENRKVFNVEYNTNQKDELEKLIASGHLKRIMRKKGMGLLAFAMFAPAEDANRKSRDKYKSILDGSAAGNSSLSQVQLGGILDMTTKVTIETAEGWQFDEETQEHVPIRTSSITMSLMDILLSLTITIQGGGEKPLFNSVGQDSSNDWDALFPGDKLREEKVTKIAAHPASWIMYHLALDHNATEDGVANFLQVAFHDTHVRLALNCSSWDPAEGAVSLGVGTGLDVLDQGDEELEELREAAAEWIDMSTLDIDDRGIQQAEDRAGAMFAHDDAVDVSSMNTQQFFENRAQTGLRRGIRGLRTSSNTTSSGARQGGHTASQRDSAANGSSPTSNHVPPGTTAGGSSDPQSKGHGGGEPPVDRTGADDE